GHELAHEADRVDDQREDPGERPESDGLDEDDRHDHRMEAAGDGDDRPAHEVDRPRHDVPGRQYAQHEAQHDADQRGDKRDLDALDEPVDHEAAPGEIWWEGAAEDLDRPWDAGHDAGPAELERRHGPHQVRRHGGEQRV